MTLVEYSHGWLASLHDAGLKPRSVAVYERCTRLYLVPALGAVELPVLSRALIRGQLLPRLGQLDRNTKGLILAVLRTMLNAAVDEEVIVANPALGMTRTLRLGPRRALGDVKAMTAEQLSVFLAAVDKLKRPVIRACLRLLPATGLRVGEAMGLRWSHVDLDRRVLIIAVTLLPHGETGTTKTGRLREVQLEPQAVEAMHILQASRRSEWVFPSSRFRGRVPVAPCTVAMEMRKAVLAAGLPAHFTPHCLRHTYASLLLSRGESIQYVQRQLGHSAITMTADVYGRWLEVARTKVGVLEGLTA
jgi:integrase